MKNELLNKSPLNWLRRLFVFAMLAFVGACRADAETNIAPRHLLVVTVTKGFRHASIQTGERVVGDLARKSGAFTVDYVRTDDDMARKMTMEALKNYDGVFFLNTTGILP